MISKPLTLSLQLYKCSANHDMYLTLGSHTHTEICKVLLKQCKETHSPRLQEDTETSKMLRYTLSARLETEYYTANDNNNLSANQLDV